MQRTDLFHATCRPTSYIKHSIFIRQITLLNSIGIKQLQTKQLAQSDIYSKGHAFSKVQHIKKTYPLTIYNITGRIAITVSPFFPTCIL